MGNGISENRCRMAQWQIYNEKLYNMCNTCTCNCMTLKQFHEGLTRESQCVCQTFIIISRNSKMTQNPSATAHTRAQFHLCTKCVQILRALEVVKPVRSTSAAATIYSYRSSLNTVQMKANCVCPCVCLCVHVFFWFFFVVHTKGTCWLLLTTQGHY